MTDANVRNSTAYNHNIATSSTSTVYTLPTGLTVGDPLRIFVASNVAPTLAVPTAPSGWSFVASPTAAGTATYWIMERTGGWQTSDGSSLTVAVSGVTAAVQQAVAVVALVGSAKKFDAAGTYLAKKNSTTTVAPAAGAAVGQDVIVAFFTKMSSQDGNPTVTPDAQVIASYQNTGSGAASIWVGSYTPGTSRDQSMINSVNSGNGVGVQILTVNPTVASHVNLRGVITSGAEVAAGATLRGIIVSGVEVAAGATLRGEIQSGAEVT